MQKVSDPRSSQGTRPLPIVLVLAILAICCGQTSYEEMQDWARNYQAIIREQLPFLAGHTPDASTFQRIFNRLDTEHIELILSEWLQTISPVSKGEGVAVDGKSVRNSELHLVAAFAHTAHTVLFQKGTDTKGKELVIVPQVINQVGIKDNQKTLREDILLYFKELSHRAKILKTTQVDKHRGRVEKQTVEATVELNEYLEWPGLTHVWRCTREVTRKGKTTVEVAYGVTRLLDNQTVEDLARLIRGHWRIENQLHWRRDVQFNEDKCTARTG